MDKLSYETASSTATNQAVIDRDERGRFAVGNAPSTGFHTNPERRSDGRWSKDTSITYWYNKIGNMTNDEFGQFKPETAFQHIALLRIQRAMRDDDSSLAETKEITDRTEGKARQDLGIEVDEKAEPIIRGFVIPTFPEGYIDEQIAKARVEDTEPSYG